MRQTAADSSDEEVKEKVTVAYQSERTVENKKDELATSTVQIDTEIEKDARTIFEKSLQGNNPFQHYFDQFIYVIQCTLFFGFSSARAERQSR